MPHLAAGLQHGPSHGDEAPQLPPACRLCVVLLRRREGGEGLSPRHVDAGPFFSAADGLGREGSWAGFAQKTPCRVASAGSLNA